MVFLLIYLKKSLTLRAFRAMYSSGKIKKGGAHIMPSVKRRGDTFRIMVSLGYGMDGRQIRKTTTYTPPEGVTPGKAEKLATAFAYEFEKQCRGMVNFNENIRFSELADWYYDQIAVHKLKPMALYCNRRIIDTYVLPYIGNMKLKDINTARIDKLFNELYRDGRKRETYRLRSPELIRAGQVEADPD